MGLRMMLRAPMLFVGALLWQLQCKIIPATSHYYSGAIFDYRPGFKESDASFKMMQKGR